MTHDEKNAIDLTEREVRDLEELCDRRGISSVLMALSEIAGLKAEIVRSRRDGALALRWETLEGAIGVIIHPYATGL